MIYILTYRDIFISAITTAALISTALNSTVAYLTAALISTAAGDALISTAGDALEERFAGKSFTAVTGRYYGIHVRALLCIEKRR